MQFSGNTCDAPWASLPAGRQLACLLEDFPEAALLPAGTPTHSDMAGPDEPRPDEAGPDGLEGFDVEGLDLAGLAELAGACHRQVARLQALEMSALAAFRRQRGADTSSWGPYSGSEISRFITEELSAATATSPGAIDIMSDLGEDLVERLPQVRQTMRQGRIDFPKAKAIADLTHLITSPENLATATARALDWAATGTAARLRRNLRNLVRRLEPDAIAERKKRSIAMRSLQLWENDDETATLAGINLEPQLAQRALNRVNALAKAAKTDGDPRGTDALRADIYLHLLLAEPPATPPPNGSTSPPDGTDEPDSGTGGETDDAGDTGSTDDTDGRGEGTGGTGDASNPGGGTCGTDNTDNADSNRSEDSVDDSGGGGAEAGSSDAGTPAGHDRRPGDTDPAAPASAAARTAARILAGLAPGTSPEAIAACARRLKSTLTGGMTPSCVTTPGPGGTPIHGSPAYRPPASMRRDIENRDRTCRYPSCNRKAVNSDIDHGIPHDRAGPTCPCNLHALCRKHHRQKQLPGWHLIDLYPGTILWITPAGHWHITTPGEPDTESAQNGAEGKHPGT